MQNFLANKTVMIVDDDPVCCALLSEFLHQFGAHVLQTSSGEEGLLLHRQSEITLIFCGLNLVDIPPVPLLRQLRVQDDQTPIIVLTDTQDLTLIAAVLRAGAKDVLLKPLVDLAALHVIILETLYPAVFSSDVAESDKLHDECQRLLNSPEEQVALLRNLQPPAYQQLAGCHVGYRQLIASDSNGLVFDIAALSDNELGFYLFDANKAGEHGIVTALLLRSYFNELLQKQLARETNSLPAMHSVLEDVHQLLNKSGLHSEISLLIGYYHRPNQQLLIIAAGLPAIVHFDGKSLPIVSHRPLGQRHAVPVDSNRFTLSAGECEIGEPGQKIWLHFNPTDLTYSNNT